MEKNINNLVVIREKFNEILSRHIKLLLGTYYELFGLSFNLSELSCLILIQYQIAGQSHTFPVCLDKYYKEKLFDEVSELGSETGTELDTAFEKLIQKECIYIDQDKNICVNKLTYSITNLLDRIYPNMSGMNLLAYIIQTMDEAMSGRKELVSALDQFDQTMQLHGVKLKKQEDKPEHKMAAGPPSGSKNLYRKKGETDSLNQRIFDRKELGVSSESSIIKSGNLIKPFHSPFSESKIAPAFTKEDIKDIEDIKIIEKKELNSQHDEIIEYSDTAKPVEQDFEKNPAKKSVVNELLKIKEEEIPANIHNKTAETEVLPESGKIPCDVSTENSIENKDDIIENRIAAFEEELAMQCPICKSGKVNSNKTATNKEYFRCSNKQCSFISWGKPFYQSCPKCKNNFLIESIQSDGQKVLRCPRTTCRHIQRIPGETASRSIGNNTLTFYESGIDEPAQKVSTSMLPIKRAVRKRVVRRKK